MANMVSIGWTVCGRGCVRGGKTLAGRTRIKLLARGLQEMDETADLIADRVGASSVWLSSF